MATEVEVRGERKKRTNQYRGFQFTYNNWTEEGVTELKATFKESGARWYIMAEEVGERCGTKHIQGAVYFKSAKTFPAAMKKMHPTIHWEPFISDCQHNRDYCLKGEMAKCEWDRIVRIEKGDPRNHPDYGKNLKLHEEWGRMPQQGARADLEELRDEIMAGKRFEEILVERPTAVHQYGRTIVPLCTVASRLNEKMWEPECEWHYGSSGAGKTHVWKSQWKRPGTGRWIKLNRADWKEHKWFEGYDRHENVVINEFRGEVNYDELLEWLEDAPHDVPVRGKGPVPFVPNKIIITSRKSPAETFWKTNENDCLYQLTRRKIRIFEWRGRYAQNNVTCEDVTQVYKDKADAWEQRVMMAHKSVLDATEVPRVILNLGTSGGLKSPPSVAYSNEVLVKKVEDVAWNLSDEDKRKLAMKWLEELAPTWTD